MLAFLHSQGVASHWVKELSSWNGVSVLAMLSMVGLAAAVMLSAATVFPRTGGNPNGVLFWSAVAQRSSAEQYVQDVADCSQEQLIQAYLTHSYELAKICGTKYASLHRAFIGSAVGFGAATVYLLIRVV